MSIFALLADILMVGDGRYEKTLPEMLSAAIIQMGGSAEIVADYIDGAPLSYNFDAPSGGVDALSELRKGQTRAIVLSETTPITRMLQWQNPKEALVAYSALATSTNPGVRVFYMENWDNREITSEAGVVEGLMTEAEWLASIEANRDHWRRIALDASVDDMGTAVTVIPAASGMAVLSREIAAGTVPGIDSLDMFFTEGKGVNGRGLYFLAMIQVATMTGQNPEGLPARLLRTWPDRSYSLNDEQALRLQQIAWQTVQAFKTLPPPAATADLAPAAVEPAPADAADAAKPPPKPVPDVIDLPGVSNPSLFVGLAPVSDWSTQLPFLDMMKTSRTWMGDVGDEFGGVTTEELVAMGALDEHGAPLFVPEGLSALSTVVLTGFNPETLGVRGRYVLRYDGKGRITFRDAPQFVSESPGRVEFDFEPEGQATILKLVESDPADPVRNITLVREDRLEAFDQGQIFNPDWLNRMRGVKGVRFMDWMATNNSTLVTFDERPKVTDATWADRGVPLEIMIALANELDADPWFTLPHLADDGFVRGYAEITRDTLEPGRKAWMEYSNEVWNWSFTQATWAEEQGQARWGDRGNYVQFYAHRASELADIWAEVFGAEADARLVRVISTQTGWRGLEEQILESEFVQGEGKPAPATHFDAYAITGYFGGGLGGEALLPLVRNWIADGTLVAETVASDLGLEGEAAAAFVEEHRFDAAIEKGITELRNAGITNDNEDNVEFLATVEFPYHAEVAAKHGLELVMYEGGSHVVGLGEALDDDTLTEYYSRLSYAPAMADVYQAAMEGWRKVSKAPFMAYYDVAESTKWGSWGGLRHLGDDNPRWQRISTGCPAC